MMNCGHCESLLNAYVDGELAGDEMLAVRQHLAHCPTCDARHQETRLFKQVLRTVPTVEPAPDFEDRLLRAVRLSEPQPAVTAGRKWQFGWVVVGAFAASMAVTFLVLRVIDQPANSPESSAIAFEIERDQAFASGPDAASGVPLFTASNMMAP